MMTARRFTDQFSALTSARKWVLLVGAILGVLTTVLGMAAGAKKVADAAYVRQDTFALYRSGEMAKRLRDSLINDARLTRIDTGLAQLVRACQRKRECP